MPIHDWTRVVPDIWHHFHLTWIARLNDALAVVLPEGYYALVERTAADGKSKRRTLTIRHSSDDRIIALVEILSPSNKKTVADMAEFVGKACGALRAGIHVVLADLYAPGKRMRGGMHAAIWKELGQDDSFAPPEKPLTVASYAAGESVVAYVEPLAVGDEMPDMPLFLTSERYVNLPLRSTYEETYRRSMPQRWREVLEAPQA